MKVLLFGATGRLGRCIAEQLMKEGHTASLVIRDRNKSEYFKALGHQIFIADVTLPKTIQTICENHDLIISALGKSVSLNDRSNSTFEEIDLIANSNILEAALKSNIKKFIYVSAFHAEKHQDLEYFRTHHAFSEKLIASGLNYIIIKPPALFSAFADLIDLAQKNKAFNIGSGDKKTNPIYEGDLAKIIVNHLSAHNQIIEAGGQYIYTRKQLLEIIQNYYNPKGRLRTLPVFIFKILLPILRITHPSTYHKFAFFIRVMEEDTIAPRLGTLSFEAYLQRQVSNHQN